MYDVSAYKGFLCEDLFLYLDLDLFDHSFATFNELIWLIVDWLFELLN